MKSMTMHQIQCLTIALPRCTLDSPNDAKCQFIRDNTGELVGEIHWVLGHISIYEDYQYHREAIRAIEESVGERFKVIEYPEEKRME